MAEISRFGPGPPPSGAPVPRLIFSFFSIFNFARYEEAHAYGGKPAFVTLDLLCVVVRDVVITPFCDHRNCLSFRFLKLYHSYKSVSVTPLRHCGTAALQLYMFVG